MEILTGKKVYLKLIEEKDMEQRAKWINDPEIQNTLMYDIPTSGDKTRAWFRKVVLDSSRREFSIFTFDGDKYIGFCGILNIEAPVMNGEHHCVIGEKAYQSGGYGTEAYRLLINYGFKELGLNKIYGYQLTHNFASHRVAEKLGWTVEGVLRQHFFAHGKRYDAHLVSILRDEWLQSDLYNANNNR